MLSEQKNTLSPENRGLEEALRLFPDEWAGTPGHSELVCDRDPLRDAFLRGVQYTRQEGRSQPGEGIVPEPSRAENGEGWRPTEGQISHMVSRFLCWRLPEDFYPDCGISFKAEFNENTPWPMRHEPVGTNLFSADQAKAMVRHMLEGLPASQPPQNLERDGSTPIQTSPSPTGGDELDGLVEELVEFLASCRRSHGYVIASTAELDGQLERILSLISQLRGRGMVRAPSRARQGEVGR